jgi:hypothetical protein
VDACPDGPTVGIGAILYDIFASTEDDVANRYAPELGTMQVPSRDFAIELMAVRWLALDYAVTLTLGQGSKRVAVLDAFLELLHENTIPGLEEFLSRRICQYAIVMNKAESEHALYVGAAFSQFVQERGERTQEQAMALAVIGAKEFAMTFDAVRVILARVWVGG